MPRPFHRTPVFSTPVFGDVTSANVVGYNNVSITGQLPDGTKKWHQIAIQFKTVGDTQDRITINEAFPTANLTPTLWKKKGGNSGSPTIQIYDGEGGYIIYYYITDAYGDASKTTGDNIHTGWANSKQVLAGGDYLKIGEGVWFTAGNIGLNTTTITVAGEVKSETSKTVTVGEHEWTVVSNPYPTDLAIKDVLTSFAPSTWKNKGKATGVGSVQIQVYDGNGGYALYYYITDAYGTAAKTSGDNIHTGWCNAKQVLASTESVPAGTAFWVKATNIGTGTLTFNLNK